MNADSLADLFEQLHSSENGLTGREAQRRLAEHGANETGKSGRDSLTVQFLRLFLSPLAIILLISGIITASLGETLNAAIICVMVLLGIVLNFVQTFRSQRAADTLRSSVAPTATVLRQGHWVEVRRREIVPGDVIGLGAGDLVPADARLLSAEDLHINQAALTGESLPVQKFASDPASPATADNSVYLGTSVVSGSATALVTLTGDATQFGDIAVRLAARAPETEFERGIRKFSLLIMRAILFLVLFVFIVNAVTRHDAFESLLFAVALAVGLTPEFLPVITTITLGQGAVKMSRQHVIVKHLEAIQNFGSIDVLCSDKTGTLTGGEMTMGEHVDPLGRPDDAVFLLAYLNSLYETGIKDPTDRLILQKANANPLDMAILKHDHPDVSAYEKLQEIPFDFERRRISVLVRNGRQRIMICKGAPESIMAISSNVVQDGVSVPMDEEFRTRCRDLYDRFGRNGYRVLAVAHREIKGTGLYDVRDETDMTLAGFLTFFDPPLEDAAESLLAMHRDGVKVKILTGDNELVAEHICRKVGLDVGRTVLGNELEKMTDPALGHIAEQTTLFARVTPAQKNRIIIALKNRGHVVGYLGDGINDAPSLHAADVGISVAGAVDVAKDAASIILMKPGLGVLHNGIIAGRMAFGNVMKYILMNTSSNFGNMFSMAVASLMLPFLPMLPMQILLNNFLYDLAQVSIPTDNVDPSMIRSPGRWNIRLIRNFMLIIGPVSSVYDFLTFFALLNLFHATRTEFHTGWFVESLATQTLVLFVIRTRGNPFRSRPSMALALTVLSVVAVSLILPFTPIAGALGFTPLPAGFYVFLAGVAVTYLLIVQLVKSYVMRRFS